MTLTPLALLLRYAVLGAVALSVLPSTAAGLASAAQENAEPCASTRQRDAQTSFAVSAPLFQMPLKARPLPLTGARRDGHAPAAPRNMTASPGGKRLALRLEMTREEAGQLLLRQITPN